jgi:predicted DNA-binding transcriptional regulator AlpA
MDSKTSRQTLRTPDAANYLALSVSTLNKLRVFGGGPNYSKLGRVVVYSVDDLDAWLRANRRSSTSVAA